jgi:uncharacterized protein YjbJ (UPF0337 family)
MEKEQIKAAAGKLTSDAKLRVEGQFDSSGRTTGRQAPI